MSAFANREVHSFPEGAEWEEETFSLWKRSLGFPHIVDFSQLTFKQTEALTELSAAWEHFKATNVMRSLTGR